MDALIIVASFAAVILASIFSRGDPWWIYGTVFVVAVLWFGGVYLGRRRR